MKEEWRKEMQHKLADYQESAPKLSWSEISKAVEAQKPSHHTRPLIIPMWGRRIGVAAAAILIVAGIGFIAFHNEQPNVENLAEKTHHNDVRPTSTPADGNNVIDKILAQISPSQHNQAGGRLLAKASETGKAPFAEDKTASTEESQLAKNQTTENKTEEKDNSEIKKEVARQHFYSSNGDEYMRRNISERKSRNGFTAGVYMSNSTNGYSQSGNSGISLASASPIGSYADEMFNYDNGILQNQSQNFDTHKHHRQPVRFGVRVSYSLTDRWSVESGITYSYLSSEIDKSNYAYRYETDQKLHFVGIPVNVNYLVWKNKHINFYVSGGGMGEKLVKGNATTNTIVEGNVISTSNEKVKINQLQWSVNGGIGAEYQLSDMMRIYAEPGVSYYLNNSSNVQTIYNDKPFNVNINVGLRIDIK